jgi:hypothetical protein
VRANDDTVGHRLPGLYQLLLERERETIDPRLYYGKPPEEVTLIKLFAPRARPDRLARLERGDPTLIPRWWLGGNHYPEVANWDTFHDRSVRGWEVNTDDVVVPVRANYPRWAQPGNRL